MYIELLRLQIFHTEKVKEASLDTLIKFGSSSKTAPTKIWKFMHGTAMLGNHM